MLRPMFVDHDLSLVALGWITGTAGFIAGMVGAMVGGAFVGAYGRYRMLMIFGLLQAVAVASYALLALGPLDLTRVYVISIFEHRFDEHPVFVALPQHCDVHDARAESGLLKSRVRFSNQIARIGVKTANIARERDLLCRGLSKRVSTGRSSAASISEQPIDHGRNIDQRRG